MHGIDIGLTKITGAGGYTDSERVIMMMVLDQAKAEDLRSTVQEIDPHAFIILCEASEVFGEGFTAPPAHQPTHSKKLTSPDPA
nr:YitT family protein [Caldalkalibacillus salinus]